jgi:predicted RNA-binding Zn-ribbon protein involved in translation (DUF1610 family)
MAIAFSCPQCGKKLKAPDNAAGKSSKCPGCGTTVTCPEPIYEAELVEPPAGGINPYDDIDDGTPYAMSDPKPGSAPEPDAPGGEARKPCPMCGEMIVATAAKCRYCGEVFDAKLKKAKKKKKKHSVEDEDLTGAEIALGILCSGIACIVGLIWVIQGKPKGGKLLAISICVQVVLGIIQVVLQSIAEKGTP